MNGRVDIEEMAEHSHLSNPARVAVIEANNKAKGMSGSSNS